MGERLGDLGEFGWIARLRGLLPENADAVVGPGDDAAALRFRPGRLVLATSDALVEGVHFDLSWSSPDDVGSKALTVNVSDIAAMGGVPRFALAAVGAPAETPVEVMEGILGGLIRSATAHGVALVGGDTVGADRIVLSVTLLGEEGEHGVVRRSGARAGDVVCVTGALGGAACGLALLRAAYDSAPAREGPDQARALLARFPNLAAAHRLGRARVREGDLAAAAGATSMIDLSDGLASDLARICEESGVGVTVEERAIPLDEGVQEAASLLGLDPTGVALGGGEDYELAMTVPRARVDDLAAALAPTSLTVVGKVIGSGRILARGDGSRAELAASGWDHFSRGGR